MNTVELLTLNLNYLNMMQQEFLDCYESLFEYSTIKLRKAWMLKLSALKSCNEQQNKWKELKDTERKSSIEHNLQKEEESFSFASKGESENCSKTNVALENEQIIQCDDHGGHLNFIIFKHDLEAIDEISFGEEGVQNNSS